jgi:chloramphenicol-sensitive protein RarD
MNKGVLYGIGAYFVWGFFPLFFKLLIEVTPLQILAHRFFWSFIFLMIIIALLGNTMKYWSMINRRVLLVYSLAGVVLAFNWGTFVYAVNTGHTLESSLGYFINPILSVMLGVIFLKERLRVMQWVPVILAAAGVLYLTIAYGAFPWLAIILASTFGFYGLLKKTSPLESMPGLTLETGALFIPAMVYLVVQESQGVGSFGHISWQTSLILASSGVVTAVPLLLFSAATRRIPLSTLGILQYITPTIQFFMGVFLFQEDFDIRRLTGFILIWIALAIFTAEMVHHQRSKQAEISGLEVTIPD